MYKSIFCIINLFFTQSPFCRCKKNVWNPSEPEGCAVCKSPGRLAGLRLQNISSSDFTCESPFNNLTQDGVIYQNYSDVTDPDEIAAIDGILFWFSLLACMIVDS